MKKNLLILIVLFCTSFAFGQSATEIAKNAIQSTVSIVALDNTSQPLGFGSGFIIEDELIATNVHVIEGSSSAYVLVNGQEKKYKIDGYLSIDKANDLVILKVSGLKQKSMTLNQGNIPEIGEKIYAIGNPKGFNGTFSEGIISGIRNFDKNQVLQITAPISPGSSGGPVLNLKGEVVGVAFATYSEGQNLNFAIPVEYLLALKNNLGILTPVSTVKKPIKSTKTNAVKPNIKEGVIIRNLEWGCWASYSFNFSIKNNLPVSVSHIKVLILVYDTTGVIVNYYENTYFSGSREDIVIKPFLAKTIGCINTLFEDGFKKGYVLKARILDFKIIEE
ncbi:S1C family serine protease [Flavobacterium sp. GSP6]|uniref:S1C family serine protease n=1 Tax=Flavobacterium sp. GSP6 TaxID=2497488 RepID=UPI000F86F0E5|nr:S1C family serine protease [Flavobacterium sp. GSP6]RTZ06827.1 serine protease [Flavobacterium sp. GSP6]